MNYVALAWRDIKAQRIKKCFINAGFQTVGFNEEVGWQGQEFEEGNTSELDITIPEYVNINKHLDTAAVQSIEEITEKTLPK